MGFCRLAFHPRGLEPGCKGNQTHEVDFHVGSSHSPGVQFFSRFLSPNPDLPRMTCVRRLLVKVRDLAQSRTPSSPVGPGSVFPANQLKLAVLLLCPRASINQWKQGGTDRFGILGEFFSNFLWTIY